MSADRRLLLGAMLACLLAVGLDAAPCAATQDVTVARLRYDGGDWYCDPSALPNWLRIFEERTGIPTTSDPVDVTLDSEDLLSYPLLYLSGHGDIRVDDRAVEELRRYLESGGFLFVDDNYGLDSAFRRLMERVFPDEPLIRLGSDHPIFHSYYDLPGLPKIHEHDGDPAQAFGIVRGERLLVLYSWSSDIGDGLEDPEVHGNPPEVREAARRMAVNILMYALAHP